ncbi:M48 family metalloprotease [Nocardiopsis sp. HNM0947]|uniref:M48 family metalloprotease n=1 Tax=Nocardiopsis coralli TaxID=2772213 RepID=A0ABR9P8H3_9ACTN|nr:M48 family metalloprotease [Nocardiopsis coralli]MBE3000142.1 M48 family metalloprotease [Nocardiopsis coralli]
MLRAWLLVATSAAGYAALTCFVAALLLGTAWWWLGLAPVALALLSAETALLLTKDGREETQEISADQEPRLHAVVDRLCALSGQSRPELRRYPSPLPNAMSRPSRPSRPSRRGRRTPPTVFVSDALLADVDPQYLEPVLAHELAHIGHRDEKALAYAEAMSGGWVMYAAVTPFTALAHLDVFVCALARIAGGRWEPVTRTPAAQRLAEWLSGPGSGPESGPRAARWKPWILALVALARAALFCFLAVMLVLPIAGFLLYVAVCWPGVLTYRMLVRRRELAADRAAAELTGQPLLLAAALTAMAEEVRTQIPDGTDLRGASTGPTAPARSAALAALTSLEFLPSAPPGEKGGPVRRFVSRIYATHPSLDRRVAQLQALSREPSRG